MYSSKQNALFGPPSSVADCVAVWNALGSISPTDTIGEVAARLCRFNADDVGVVNTIDESVQPAQVTWGPAWTPPTAGPGTESRGDGSSATTTGTPRPADGAGGVQA